MVQPDTGWVSRWVVSAFDALIDTESRMEIDENLQEVIAARPQWFSAWLSGHLSDLVRSLDPEDPWRNLKLENGKAVRPDGSPFGSYQDATDLVIPSQQDLRADIGLAALRSKLPEKSAALIAVASRGWDQTLHWCETELISGPELSPEEAAELFRVATSALRWAIHRRRLYLGHEDPFAAVNGFAWIGRAHKMIAGDEWDEDRAERTLLESSVPPGTYTQLT